MATANFALNLDSVEPFSSYIHIPKGEWNFCIVSVDLTEDKNKTPILEMIYKVTEGSAQGGEIKEQLALWLPKTEDSHGGRGEISRRSMRTLTDALGVHGEFVPATLVGKHFTATTDIKFGDQGASFPRMKKVKAFVGQGRATGADAVQPQAPAAGVGRAAAPVVPTLPSFGAAPAAPAGLPAFGAPQAPAAMPAGFQMPGQQTAPAAPAMTVPPMGGFAPPAAPAPAFAPPATPAAPAPWGAPQIPGR